MRYIRKYNESPKRIIKWKYADTTRRIMPVPFH